MGQALSVPSERMMCTVSIIKYDNAKSKLIATLMLAAAGYKVFPVDKNKRPRLKGWQQKATTDPEQIRAWFDCENLPNIGVVTGRDSGPDGLFCFDVDGPEGLICLEALEKNTVPWNAFA